MIAGGKQSHDRRELGCHSAGNRNRARSVFKGGDSLFKNRRGRVADASVDIAVLLELEQVRRLVCVAKHVRRRLINGYGSSSNIRIRNLSGMQHASFKAKVSRVLHCPKVLPEQSNGGLIELGLEGI